MKKCESPAITLGELLGLLDDLVPVLDNDLVCFASTRSRPALGSSVCRAGFEKGEVCWLRSCSGVNRSNSQPHVARNAHRPGPGVVPCMQRGRLPSRRLLRRLENADHLLLYPLRQFLLHGNPLLFLLVLP